MDFSFDMAGSAIVLGISAIGCCIGCCIAGQAAHAAMTKTDDQHGKFISLSAAPSSQIIYGFILMWMMSQKVENGTLSPIDSIVIGLFAGGAFLASSVFQGKVAATGIEAVLKKPSTYGKSFVAVGIIESFALFAFVFSLLIM